MEVWIRLVMVGAGGALGANARYWLGVWMNRWVSPQFPWATFTINVSGSLLIGLLTISLGRWLPHPNLRLLVITGFLGGYTTFSTFEFESATLWERGELGLLAANMAGSVAAGFVAVLLGIALARGISPELTSASAGLAPRVAAAPPPSAPSAHRPSTPESPGELASEGDRRMQ